LTLLCKMGDNRVSDPMPGSILCLGNALLDVSFVTNKAILDKHNLKANDAILVERDRFDTILGDLEACHTAEDFVPGGSAQNTARSAQWLLAGFPETVSYMGCINRKDRFGEMLRERCRQVGVNAIYQLSEDTPTGSCLVIVTGENNKHRSMAACLGAACSFTADHVREHVQHVEKAQIIYIEGYFLSTCIDACELVAKHASSMPSKRFICNISAPFVVQVFKDLMMRVVPYIDVLMGNDTEAQAFAESLGFDADTRGDMKKVALALAALPKARDTPARIVVITQGEKPVIVANGGVVEEFAVPVTAAADIVDTNGAGDAFVGGFLAQLVRGRSLPDCVASGNSMASLVIRRIGCTFPNERPNLDSVPFCSK